MKITKKQIKQIIKEEINQISEINESEYARDRLLKLSEKIFGMIEEVSNMQGARYTAEVKLDYMFRAMSNIRAELEDVATNL